MFLKAFSTLFTFLVVGTLQAQTINGKITDQDLKPVPSVTVHLLNTNIYVATGPAGLFSINDSIPGNYLLQLSAVGYATMTKPINISKEANPPLEFRLQSTMKQLDAVMVTAEKKEELLQQVPSSITVLDAKEIQEFRLWDVKQLTAIVPNFYSGNSGDQRNVTSIRGIATTSYDPSVVTYVDGVNQFTLDTYISQLLDVERIEVLRGPQGTLYGRNAMGGVINIITRQPSNRTEGFAELNIGNYGQQRYSANVRFPLIKDKLFIGASGFYDKSNGYYTNEFNNTHFDKHEIFMGNYFLKYLLNPHWSSVINIKYQNNKNNGAFPLVNGVDEAFNNSYNVNQNAIGTMIDHTLDASFSIIHKGRGINFSSQLAWQHNYRYYNSPLDGDFSPVDAVTIINNYGKPWNDVKALTHEFRFSSPTNKSSVFNWTAGTYFFHQYQPNKQATHFGKDAGLLGVPDSNFSTINTTEARNSGFAIYAQANYHLTKKLALTAGIRYDYEHKNLNVLGEYQKDGQDPFTTLNDTAAAVNFSAVSPKLALQYSLSANSYIHISYTRGYRTGGLTQLSSDPSQPPLYPYKPEYSNNMELGIKNNFLQDKLQLNITAFLTYVNNAQVPTLILPDAITVTKNTGALNSKGVELEFAAKPVKGLQIDYNFGYTHAQYSSLKLASNGQTADLDGKKQIFTPAVTSLFAVQYSCMIIPEKHIMAIARGEWQYLGTQYFDLENTIRQSFYSLLNTRIGVSCKHVAVFFWARNISNKKYIEYAYDFGAVHLGNPETYGVTVRTTF